MKKEILEWIKIVTFSVIIAIIVTHFIRPVQVSGMSMYPTLENKDFLISENINEIQRGDIISFKSDIPFSEEELRQFNFLQRIKLGKTKNLIKRVIAVGDDELIIKEGKVFVNGKELKEDYISGNYTSGDIYIKSIPKGKIFVMGDNRGNSTDSRVLGLIDLKDVQGKVFIRIFPISLFGSIY